MRRRALPAVLLLAALPLIGCSDPSSPGTTTATTGPSTDNVLAEHPQTLVPNPRVLAAAKQADADGDTRAAIVLSRLAEVPTGVWLTPERLPVDQVGAYVAAVVATSGTETVPVFVIYGIPDRDCTGSFSAGGLSVDTYLPWVQAIADAAGDTSIVVLEPDALASSVSCTGDADRIRLLTQATEALVTDGVTTYLDAGHSYWVPVATMARLLTKVGVSSVRGFATNVANYQPLSKEKAYAAELSRRLDDAHYVIDTGRDGDPAGTARPVADWCNPGGRALGEAPGYVDDGTALDALLWIKPPAESDGPCHGGPAAGEVWIERAVELGEAAGW